MDGGGAATCATAGRGRGGGVRLTVLLLAGLAVRLALAPVGAFAFDLDLVRRWATRLASGPPWRFYDVDGLTVDHLPGDLWLLLGISRAYHALAATPDVDGRLFLVLLKLPPALADVGIGALLFGLGRRLAGERAGLTAAAAWLFNPAPIFVGSIWGQWDALSAGLALAALWLLLRGSPAGAMPTLAYAALIKPPLVLLAPLGALWFVRRWGAPWRAAGARGRRAWLGSGVGVVAALLVVVLVPLPFGVGLEPLPTRWGLLARMRYALERYPYAGLNAFNLWGAIGANGTDDGGSFALGVSARVWGTVLLAGAYAAILRRFWRRAAAETALVWACLATTLALFVLPTRVHERYLFPALVFAALAATLGSGWGRVYALLSATYLANVVAVYVLYATEKGYFLTAGHPAVWAASLVNVAVLGVVLLRPPRGER